MKANLRAPVAVSLTLSLARCLFRNSGCFCRDLHTWSLLFGFALVATCQADLDRRESLSRQPESVSLSSASIKNRIHPFAWEGEIRSRKLAGS